MLPCYLNRDMHGTRPSKPTIKDTNVYICEAEQQCQHSKAEVSDYMQSYMQGQSTDAQTEQRVIEDQLEFGSVLHMHCM